MEREVALGPVLFQWLTPLLCAQTSILRFLLNPFDLLSVHRPPFLLSALFLLPPLLLELWSGLSPTHEEARKTGTTKNYSRL